MVLAGAWVCGGEGVCMSCFKWVIAVLKCDIFECNFFHFLCVGGCVGGGGNGSWMN